MTGRTLPLVAIAIFLAVNAAGQGPAGPPAKPHAQQLAGEGNSPQEPTPTGGPRLERRDPRYRLCKGDVLELSFTFTPEFNQTVTVQPDGYITLRGLGDMRVEGKTTPELIAALQDAYGKMLHDPAITVDLKDFDKPYLIVGGEVGRPGKYDLRGDTTVAQAVAIAGGFRETAKHSQVLVFRSVSNEWVEVRKLDLKRMLQARNLEEDLHLRSGDMVFVPKNFISKIAQFIPRPMVGMYFNPSQY